MNEDIESFLNNSEILVLEISDMILELWVVIVWQYGSTQN